MTKNNEVAKLTLKSTVVTKLQQKLTTDQMKKVTGGAGSSVSVC